MLNKDSSILKLKQSASYFSIENPKMIKDPYKINSFKDMVMKSDHNYEAAIYIRIQIPDLVLTSSKNLEQKNF